MFRGRFARCARPTNVKHRPSLCKRFWPKCFENLSKIFQNNFQNLIENPSNIHRKLSQIAPKIPPKSHPNRSRERLGLGAPFSSILDASWAAPGPITARLGSQVGGKLATKTQPKSIRNRYQNRPKKMMRLGSLLASIFHGF